MNNNDLLYEVALDKDSKLIIITYAIKYSNCKNYFKLINRYSESTNLSNN